CALQNFGCAMRATAHKRRRFYSHISKLSNPGTAPMLVCGQTKASVINHIRPGAGLLLCSKKSP
ncbi:MAG: hypothetical protein KDF48_08980, partial [Rhodocyclaceae bacterium]|nr:hypothetical protein [Rhodocyclaceae bacterium]